MPRRKQTDTELEIASSPYPIMPVRPKGVRYKGEGRINYEELRAQMNTPPPPPRPSTPSQSVLATPPRKRNPEDIMFIKRPSPSTSQLRSPSEKSRCVSSPYASPSRPTSGASRRVFSGPSPGIKNVTVPQKAIYPSSLREHERVEYPAEDTVYFGAFPEAGCAVGTPDAVSTKPLNLPSIAIVICFQWKGYEAYGEFSTRVVIPKFRQKPFDSRRHILKEVKRLYLDFKGKVAQRRRSGEDKSIPSVDVLAFEDDAIRVTRLERRSDTMYQVMFTFPFRVLD